MSVLYLEIRCGIKTYNAASFYDKIEICCLWRKINTKDQRNIFKSPCFKGLQVLLFPCSPHVDKKEIL